MQELLNTYLHSKGKSITGEYIYRLIWSDSILEHRKGTFNEFTESGLFIRTFTGVKLLPKYNYIKDRWILEKWAPGSITRNNETPDAYNGDYLPVYVFEDGDGNYLPPTRKVLEFILSALDGRIKRDIVPDEKYLEEKEVEDMVESFDDHPGYFKTSGDARNAVAFSKQYAENYPKELEK
jgi:hypothetical protein